jgi:FkbM family methyltransferase
MSYAAFHQAVRALADPFVVQVGACDGVAYDPVREVILERRLAGLLLEPLTDLYALCKSGYRAANCHRLMFANLAVAREPGMLLMRRVPTSVASQLPPWVLGLGTARNHNMLTREVAERHQVPPEIFETISNNIELVEVQAYPLRSILFGYGIHRVDVLVVDVEGMEREVIESLDLPRYAPPVMLIEHTTMSSSDKAALATYVQNCNYALTECEADWLAIRRDHLKGNP